MNRWIVVVLGVMLASCIWYESFHNYAYLGSTSEDAVEFIYSNGPLSDGIIIDQALISGVVDVTIDLDPGEDGRGKCAGTARPLSILDAESGETLYEHDLANDPICEDDRWVWNGQRLVKLDDGLIFGIGRDDWPDELHVAAFQVASTGDDPVLVEHGPQPDGEFSLAGEGEVDGITEFMPGTICPPGDAPYVVRAVDPDTGEVLGIAGVPGDICDAIRLVWDGEQFHALEDDAPWPADLFRDGSARQGG